MHQTIIIDNLTIIVVGETLMGYFSVTFNEIPYKSNKKIQNLYSLNDALMGQNILIFNIAPKYLVLHQMYPTKSFTDHYLRLLSSFGVFNCKY